MSEGFRLELPLPPSVNRAYRNVPGRGRVATSVLKQWKMDAGWEIKLSTCGRVRGKYRLEILVPEDMPGDVDNRLKAVSDILSEYGLTPDDRMAWGMSSDRSPDVPVGRCLVVVEAVA